MKCHSMVILDNNQDRLKKAQFHLLYYHNIHTMEQWDKLKVDLTAETMADGRQRIVCVGGSKQVRYSRDSQKRLWGIRKSHGTKTPYPLEENTLAISYQLRKEERK